jgi:hypothetical protein
LVLPAQHQTEEGVSFGEVGLQTERLLIGGLRFGPSSGGAQSAAEIAVISRHARLNGDGLSNERDSGLGSAGLVCDNAQQVQSVGVAWLGLQDLPIDELGLSDLACLMEPYRCGQQIRGGGHG